MALLKPGLLVFWSLLAGISQLEAPVLLAWVRAPVVLGFLLVCPGAAWLGLLRFDSRATELVLSVALSLALLTLLSELTLLSPAWPLGAGFWALILIGFLGATVQLVRGVALGAFPSSQKE